MARHFLDVTSILGLGFIDTENCHVFNGLFWGQSQWHHELRAAAAAAAALDGLAAAWPPCPAGV